MEATKIKQLEAGIAWALPLAIAGDKRAQALIDQWSATVASYYSGTPYDTQYFGLEES